jgi:hypothetical protein
MAVRVHGLLPVALLMLTWLPTAGSAVLRYTQHLNMPSLHPPSTLPVFGGYAGSSASPAVPPLSFEGKISDSCPDDIRENQIQQILPTLRRL